ncbi:MAG: hypothetical protein CM15mV127_300 [Caudoviricetes sp.]|nr:MAG: hypothetical protein CM15mV127_300 [Caudoviricetes sp.]
MIQKKEQNNLQLKVQFSKIISKNEMNTGKI